MVIRGNSKSQNCWKVKQPTLEGSEFLLIIESEAGLTFEDCWERAYS